jgi:Fuc2NAc and GlcNAc transferase
VPISIFVGLGLLDEILGMVIAYTPLVFIVCLFNAGALEEKADS